MDDESLDSLGDDLAGLADRKEPGVDHHAEVGDPYRPLRFLPMPNRHVVGLATAPLFSAGELEALSDIGAGGGEPLPEWLDDRLAGAVAQANAEFFRFDVEILHDAGEPEVKTITSFIRVGPLSAESSTRKLTLFLPISASDPDRSVVRLVAVGKSAALVPGVAVIFPSYLESEVDPGAGEIVLLVSHALGAAFR